MARKGRLAALSAAFIFSVIFVISLCVGCDLWMNDWKGYLEYWSETLQMGRVEVTGATIQKNDSGVDTISLSAPPPTITGYIINPKDYNLNKTVGNDSSSTDSVRISSGVDGLASVTGDNTMMVVRLASASGKIEEHTDFTVTFVPVRTDTGVESSSRMSVTLQYNTPPRAPLALMWDSSNSAFVQLQSQAWQPTTGTGTDKDGYIYWGWPEDSYVGSNSFDETAADCAAQFSINGTLHDASNLLVKDSNGSVESFISGSAPYDVYGLQVGSGISVSLFAQDSEGIAGTSLRSGVAPYTITLLGNGGQYNGADTHQLYLQGGSTITKDDLAIFQKQGYKLSGWRDSNGAISVPYTVKNDVTLTAQWKYEEPPKGADGATYEVSNHGHLLWIGEQLKAGKIKSFKLKLTADIVVPAGEWVPIGLPNGISVTFDGQGHSITFDGTSGGLFADCNYSTIENLVLKGNITGNSVKGALIKSAYCTVIRNVMSLVEITNTGTGSTGGLVGTFGGKDSNGQVTRIENCAVYADVSSSGYAGGLVGELWNGNQYGKILNSVYMGKVTGNKAGAVVGYNNSNKSSPSTLENIYYCVTNNSNIAVIGDIGSGGTVVNNVVSKTKDEIKSQDTVNILGSSRELKSGEDYPTLKQNP